MHPDKRQEYIIIFALWLLVFAASSQIMIISPILPRIAEQLSAPVSQLGILVTAYAAMVGVFALVMGPVSDKIGRRKILLLGTGGMAATLFAHGLVFDFWSLMTVRALSGIAGGVLSGAAVAYVGDYFPYERRGWASGWIMSGIAMGQILGIPIGTLLAEYFGFKMPFILFGGIMGLTYILVFLKVPQPDVQLDTQTITVMGSLRKYGKLLQRGDIRATALSYTLTFLSISAFVVYLPTWLENDFGVSGNEIAGLFFVGGIANVISSPQAGRLSDRLGRKNIIIGSCFALSVVMAASTYVTTSFVMAYPLFFIVMILIAMRISPFQALSSELVSSNNRGALMSLLVAIGQIGYGIGGAVAGPAYELYGYASNTFIAAFTILLMVFVFWKFVPEPKLKKVVQS